MSSLPLLLNLIDELDRETYNHPSYFGNDFGLGLYPHHIQRHHQHQTTPMVGYSLPMNLFGRLAQRQRIGDKICAPGAAQLAAVGKDGFQVCMDVAQFKPNELNVKVVDDSVVVEGKHEEREDDHGFITRHFVRRYKLPKSYDAEKVASTLSTDGVLTVSVPKPPVEDRTQERTIQIQQVGPAHLNVKSNTLEEEQEAQQKAALAANGNNAEK